MTTNTFRDGARLPLPTKTSPTLLGAHFAFAIYYIKSVLFIVPDPRPVSPFVATICLQTYPTDDGGAGKTTATLPYRA